MLLCISRRLVSNFRHPSGFYLKKFGWIPSRQLSGSGTDDKNNVILMGSPGSGKTTVGRNLAKTLARQVVDVDDDFLEVYWNMPVAQKLKEVGHGNFVEAEGRAFMDFSSSNSIVSLTGSNPMYGPAQDHIRSLGTVVYLDVGDEIVVERLRKLNNMRIVGQFEGQLIEDVLKYRKQFYEGVHDIRVLVEKGESDETTTEKVLRGLESYKERVGYRSTRSDLIESSGKSWTFLDVVRDGLAQDGGLYVPASTTPFLQKNEWERLLGLSYKEQAQIILEKWIHPEDLHPRTLSEMLAKSYNADVFRSNLCPTVHLSDNQYLMELFHGPTASFKDFALQLMPQFFQAAMGQTSAGKYCYLILVATSGDTGSAVMDGFTRHSDPDRTKVMILYPEEGISEIQKHQMTAAKGRNVHVVGVKSDFDYCQMIIKDIFNDENVVKRLATELNVKLSAANSINWGRLLPQVVYHVSSYLDLVQQQVITMGDPIDLCIPTGNFGNILSAYYAKEMGIPIRRLILASNRNNVLSEFFNTGRYNLRDRRLQKTMSPAIDILKSSNLERYLYHQSGGDTTKVDSYFKQLGDQGFFEVEQKLLNKFQDEITADWCTEEECARTIKQTFDNTGYLLDPHTAIAKAVADRHRRIDVPLVIASTAHYAKFSPDVLKSLGMEARGSPQEMVETLENLTERPGRHQSLRQALERTKIHKNICEPRKKEVMKELVSFIRH